MREFAAFGEFFGKNPFLGKTEGPALFGISKFKQFLNNLNRGYLHCRMILPLLSFERVYGLFLHFHKGENYA